MWIQNQGKDAGRSTKWDRQGTVIAVKDNDQVLVRVHGSGRITIRNRRFLRKYEAAMPVVDDMHVAVPVDVPDLEVPAAVPGEPVYGPADVPGEYLPVEVPVDVPVMDSEEHVEVPVAMPEERVADPEEHVEVPKPRGRPPKKRQYFRGTPWQSMRPSEEASQQQHYQQQLNETPDKNGGGPSRFSTREHKQRKLYDSASGTYVLPSSN